MDNIPPYPIVFDVPTPLGFSVRTTYDYWKIIVNIKHPVMMGRAADVRDTLQYPDEVRQSKSDDGVFLFYRVEREKRWLCAVARRLNGDGFLITAYVTDAIKEGIQVWPK